MSTRLVATIYTPYLNELLYYVSNHEWSFEIKEARFFNSEQEAHLAINRLKSHDVRDLNLHSIDPQKLFVKISQQEVAEGLHFSL